MKKLIIISMLIMGTLQAKEMDCNSNFVMKNLHKVVSDKDIKKITNIEVKKNMSKCNVKYFNGEEKDFIIELDGNGLYMELIYI